MVPAFDTGRGPLLSARPAPSPTVAHLGFCSVLRVFLGPDVIRIRSASLSSAPRQWTLQGNAVAGDGGQWVTVDTQNAGTNCGRGTCDRRYTWVADR